MADGGLRNEGPIFEPFRWIKAGPGCECSDEVMELLHDTIEVVTGAETALELVRQNDVQMNCEDKHPFSLFEAGRLEGLAITALRLLGEKANRFAEKTQMERQKESK